MNAYSAVSYTHLDVYKRQLQRTENDTATITVLRDGKLVTLPQVQFDSTTNADGTTSMVLDFRVYGCLLYTSRCV